MTTNDLRDLMQRVLDGEASAEETAALQRQLAVDPAARAEHAELAQLHQRLAALPQPHPPEGLVAAVMSAVKADLKAGVTPELPRRTAAALSADPDQPSASSRVLAPKPDDIRVGPGSPDHPSPRRVPMSQSSSLFAKPKTWIAAGVAAVALVVIAQFGFQGQPRRDDLTGTVVPAERYRAPQAGAQDIQLGDTSVARLMQNDAFVKLIKDPQVRKMASDPGFQAAAKVMLANPEAAKVLLANNEAARFLANNNDAAKAVLANAEASRALLANAEAARALMANAEAAKVLQANPLFAGFVASNAEAAKALAANSEAAKVLAANSEAARALLANAEAAKSVLAQAEVARFVAANADAARFMAAHAEAAKFASLQAEAAKVLAANSEAARWFASNNEAAKVLLANSEAARVVAGNSEAARFLLSNSEAARQMMANPEASRALMQSNEAAIRAVYQSVDANQAAKN